MTILTSKITIWWLRSDTALRPIVPVKHLSHFHTGLNRIAAYFPMMRHGILTCNTQMFSASIHSVEYNAATKTITVIKFNYNNIIIIMQQ